MKKKLKYTALILVIITIIFAIPELLYSNRGESKAVGSVRNGTLENSYLLPYSGDNFRYFSWMSYYCMNNGYLHSDVYKTVLQAYATCERTCPDIRFRVMECADKHGGKMLLHRTHQNGMSVDFMVPKKNGNRQSHFFDRLGLWHYLLEFTDSGKLKFNKNVEIDFETMARHILALDDAARNNGLRIRKVIFKVELKDDFFNTPSGKKVKQRGIYFVRALTPFINKVHDDHYHIDFEKQ